MADITVLTVDDAELLRRLIVQFYTCAHKIPRQDSYSVTYM